MKVDQVLNCSFERWYDKFKSVTIKSEIIPIGDDVLNYLRSDETCILPKSCHSKAAKSNDHSDYESDDDDFSDDEEGEENDEANVYDFPKFDSDIQNTIDNLNGKIFIKLNWSSPKDAYWSMNSLACEFLKDVYMLLCSSDFISHDLNQPFNSCDENSADEITNAVKDLKYYLIARKWRNINPCTEFRCFVRDNKLIGISQRDCRVYYKYVNDNREKIKKIIEDFYEAHIANKFFDSSYVFDVYVKKNDGVCLVDFNPFGTVTDSLLFDWNELTANEFIDVQFCYVDHDSGVPSNPYGVYGIPKDMVDIFQGGNHDKLVDLLKEQAEQQAKEDNACK